MYQPDTTEAWLPTIEILILEKSLGARYNNNRTYGIIDFVLHNLFTFLGLFASQGPKITLPNVRWQVYLIDLTVKSFLKLNPRTRHLSPAKEQSKSVTEFQKVIMHSS